MAVPRAPRRVPVLVAVIAAAWLATACGGGSDGATADGGVDPSEWVAAELGVVPDGYVVSRVDQSSSSGRRVGYGVPEEGLGDNWSVLVTTSTSFHGSTIDEVIDLSTRNGIDAEAEVAGRRAAVGPMTDEGRTYGYQVVWEQSPGVVVSVEDARYEGSTPVSTRESALELASQVVGMDRPGWDAALSRFEAEYPYAGPADDAVEREVADGVLDARQWTLSVLEDPRSPGFQGCFRLGYAGEDTGPGCSVQRVVLGGKGFVIGWTGASVEAPELVAGAGSSFDPIRPQVHDVDADGGSRVWIAVLPDGACGVELAGAPGSVDGSTLPLDLLPGDPGAVECATS